MKQCNYSREALFQLNGIPPLGMSISLALQHLVAMIVGCVTPAIIIANALGLPQSERVLLIQVSLVMSAVTTLIELFPIGGKLGSGLPVMFGISFAYLPSMQAIVGGGGDIATIAGAMVVGGIVAAVVGVFVKKIRRFFPPIITGTVVFTIGLSLYPTAINYMAGGAGNTYEAAKGLDLRAGSRLMAKLGGGGVHSDRCDGHVQQGQGHLQACRHSAGHDRRVYCRRCVWHGGSL
mgnify:CR=1 FL=1